VKVLGCPGNRGSGDEAGYIALELALAVALLLFPVALLVIALPTWSERKSMAELAAREAARTAAVSLSLDRARMAARQVVENHGIDGAEVSGPTFTSGSRLSRGGRVTAEMTVRVPMIPLPGLGRMASFSWTASHTERVDQYRSQ
jgi:Flp pilus assembly protein TadG